MDRWSKERNRIIGMLSSACPSTCRQCFDNMALVADGVYPGFVGKKSVYLGRVGTMKILITRRAESRE
jgi:hypothetical protein